MRRDLKVKKKRRFSLRYKWILFICGAIFISLMSTVIFTQITVNGIFKADDAAVNKNNANHASAQVNTELKGFEDSIEQLSELITTQLNREDPISGVQASIQAVERKNELVTSAYYMDGDTGKLHASPPMEFDQDARETRTYTELTAEPATRWMGVYEDIVDGTIMTSVVTPVMLDGQMVGALGYDIDLSTIGQTRESIEKGTVNKLVILDAEGVVVSSFMKDADGKNMNPANSGEVEGVDDILADKAQMKSDFRWVEEMYKGASTSSSKFTWEGKTYNLYTTKIPDLNWQVISFNPTDVLAAKMGSIMKTGIISIVIGLVIGIVCASFLARKLTKIITNLKNTLGKTAQGDLATEFLVTSNDELGDLSASYNDMLRNMRALVAKVEGNVDAVHEASSGLKEIASENSSAIAESSRAVEEIASGTANQSEELEEGSTAIHSLDREIETLIQQSNTNQQEIKEASAQLENGTYQVSHLDESYQQLEGAFRKVTDMIASLDEKSKSISEVTNAISQIAEQTNLLSLNASIEAARAGEHGKGFAVVANEVRNLAEESKTATANIQDINNTVLEDTRELVEVMKETNHISHQQKDAVTSVSLSITDLAVSLNKMLELIREETKVIDSVQSQKEVVVQMIEEITAVSQQTTAASEEIASSMEEQSASSNEVARYTVQLETLVKELEEALSGFQIKNQK